MGRLLAEVDAAHARIDADFGRRAMRNQLAVGQHQHTIRELKREGLSVLLCEQNLRYARLVADRVCLIEKGRARYAGSLASLDADPALRERYLSV